MSWGIELREKSGISSREDGTVTMLRSTSPWEIVKYFWSYRFLYFGRKPHFRDWTLIIHRMPGAQEKD